MVEAQNDYNRKSFLADCEVNPAFPPCPPSEVTGQPGVSGQALARIAERDAAEDVLRAAVLSRDTQEPGISERIDDLTAELTRDEANAAALAKAEQGLLARWGAMHDYTFSNASALSLRLFLVLFLIFLDLVPLLMKLWRGPTQYDERILARRARNSRALHAHTTLRASALDVMIERQRIDQAAEINRSRLIADTDLNLEQIRQELRLEKERQEMMADALSPTRSVDDNGDRAETPEPDLDRAPEESLLAQQPADAADPEDRAGDDHRHAGAPRSNTPTITAPEPEDYDLPDSREFSAANIPHSWDPEDHILPGLKFGDERFVAVAPLDGADVGGYGRVLRGFDTFENSLIVIKAVREPRSDRRRFNLFRKSPHRRMWEGEVGAAQALRHQNVGVILGSGVEHGYMWTAAPLYEPGSLVRWIARKERDGHPLTMERTFGFITQLVGALAYAHQLNVTHGDIKPSNLVLDGPDIVLIDWALTRAVGKARRSSDPNPLTRPLGTPGYMAPEVRLDEDYTTELADLYSIGATWHYLLVGHAPRLGEMLLRELLPGLPPEVADLVHRLLAPHCDDRCPGGSKGQPALHLHQELRRLRKSLAEMEQLHLEVGRLAVKDAWCRRTSPSHMETHRAIADNESPNRSSSGQCGSAPAHPLTAPQPKSENDVARHKVLHIGDILAPRDDSQPTADVVPLRPLATPATSGNGTSPHPPPTLLTRPPAGDATTELDPERTED